MAFRDLFKKKEGGSFLGNVIRKVGDTFTGGMVSNLMPKPTASDVIAQEKKWASKGVKFTPSGLVASGSAAKSVENSRSVNPDGSDTPPPPPPSDNWFMKNWKKLAAGVGGLVALLGVIFGIRKLRNRNKPKSYRRR